MKFESGMLGFLIIVLAVGGAIAGTILLSAEEQTEEVTKYNLVADVTGLFDADESPQYLDYDLAKNYTGYFTTDTIENEIEYWGGASFTETSVNNYPVKYKPTGSSTSGTYDLNDYENLIETTPPGVGKHIQMNYSYGSAGYGVGYGISVTIQSVLNELDLDEYDYVILTSPSANVSDNVYFTTTDQYKSQGDNYYAIYYENDPETILQWNQGCLSCKINLITNQVDYFSKPDASMSSYVRTVSLENAAIVFKEADSPYYTSEIIGESVGVTAWYSGVTEYMDISRGVTVTGVTS